MTVRKLQADGDIATSGEQFISGQREIAQTIKTRLSLFLGEYFRNIEEGTDWFGKILGKGQGLGVAEAEIRRRITETDGVYGLASFSTDFDLQTRKLTVSASVITPYGNTPINFEGGV